MNKRRRWKAKQRRAVPRAWARFWQIAKNELAPVLREALNQPTTLQQALFGGAAGGGKPAAAGRTGPMSLERLGPMHEPDAPKQQTVCPQVKHFASRSWAVPEVDGK